MRSERCKRCPDEDTNKCDGCELVKQDVEKVLQEILDKEHERIKGEDG